MVLYSYMKQVVATLEAFKQTGVSEGQELDSSQYDDIRRKYNEDAFATMGWDPLVKEVGERVRMECILSINPNPWDSDTAEFYENFNPIYKISLTKLRNHAIEICQQAKRECMRKNRSSSRYDNLLKQIALLS